MASVTSNRPALMFRPGVLFWIILAAATVLRLVLALTYPHYWGVDGGASGETVNYFLGRVDFWNGFPKPPLAPGFLLAPFWLLLGPDTGYKVWSALFAVLPLIPVYLLTRKYTGEWAAVFATAFAAIDITWGSMFVTGSHPLVAFALLGLAFWSIGELAERFSWRNAAVLALSIGLIPWVNQTTAGLAVIVLPVYWVGLAMIYLRPHFKPGGRFLVTLAGSGSRPFLLFIQNTLPSLFIGGIIALGALPWYLQTLPGSEILTYQGPTWLWAWGWNTFQAFLFAFPVGLFLIWKGNQPGLKALGAVLLVLGFMVNWLSYDEVLINPVYRARYFMALAAYPAIGWLVWRYALPWLRSPRIAWALGAAMFIYVSVGFVYSVRLQNEYSLMVSRDSARALEILRETDPNANVGSSAFAMSLWVSALNQVRSPWITTAPPPPAYEQMDEDMRCLFNWLDYPCDPAQARDRLNIEYLLVEERFPDFERNGMRYRTPEGHWQRTAEAGWLELVYSEGTTRLWRIESSESVHRP